MHGREPFLLRCLARLVGLWAWACRFDLRGVEGVRQGYARLSQQKGPILLCASHVTLADGPLLWWIFSARRSPWVVIDVASFASPWLRFLLERFPRAVLVSQGAGLAAQRDARRKLASLIERGETVLIFPEGTERSPFSYLVGSLLQEFPETRIGLVQLRATPQLSSWAFPATGTRLDLGWATLSPNEEGQGLSGLKAAAERVRQALEAVPC